MKIILKVTIDTDIWSKRLLIEEHHRRGKAPRISKGVSLTESKSFKSSHINGRTGKKERAQI